MSSVPRIAVAGLLVALAAGCTDASVSPRGHGPTASRTPSVATAPVTPLANGRIQGVEDYLARVHPACDDCHLDAGAFDQATGNLLVASRRTGLVGLSVVGAEGQLAALSCPEDFTCRRTELTVETLGPGAHRLTLLTSRRKAEVIGYDGTRRRTIDLSAVVDGSSEVRDLAWSRDGSRLAVTTWDHSSGLVSHIWLVDRDGGDPQRVHTAAYTGPLSGTPLGYLWSLVWSPDGRSLGFIEEQARLANHAEESLSLRAVVLELPGPGQAGPGTPRTVHDYALRPSDGAAILWSPDGTRVAVRDFHPVLKVSKVGTQTRRYYRQCDRVLELSAEDGSLLGQHSVKCAGATFSWPPLIWPARLPIRGPVTWSEPLRSHDAMRVIPRRQVQGWTDPRDTPFGGIDLRRVSGAGREYSGVAVIDGRNIPGFSAGHWELGLVTRPPRTDALAARSRVIEYGVVVDADGDREPDCQVGINNDARQRGAYPVFRVWVTNLRTATTNHQVGPPYGGLVEFAYPSERGATASMAFSFLGDRPATCDRFGPASTFYAYSSLSEDGKVTAWDFAPDAAWLPMACSGACREVAHR